MNTGDEKLENLITVKDLCKTYISNNIGNNVLRNINFTLQKGEFVTVMGPSGSGKSTLLYTVSGMDSLTSGTVVFMNQELSKLNEKELTDLRLNKMGFIFQQMFMMKKLCIMDNIVLPGYQARREDREVINARAEERMRRLGIIETAEREITEVSGGQLQRACMCRALINRPEILFADEPTGSLNSHAAEEVMDEICRVHDEGTSVMMVTHSVRVAARSQRVIYLSDGRICGELIFNDKGSQNDYVKREHDLNNWLAEHGW